MKNNDMGANVQNFMEADSTDSESSETMDDPLLTLLDNPELQYFATNQVSFLVHFRRYEIGSGHLTNLLGLIKHLQKINVLDGEFDCPKWVIKFSNKLNLY